MINKIAAYWHDFVVSQGWIIHVFIALLITAVLHRVWRSITAKLHVRAEKTHNILDDVIVEALYLPISFLIWLIGGVYAANIARVASGNDILFAFVPVVRTFGILLIVTWTFLRFIRRFEHHYIAHSTRKKKTVDKTLIHALAQLISISIVITSILVGMQLYGIPISGLLAFGGVGGAGIAFASKDLLVNFFGGLVIYLDRPFKVGDWIRSPDKNIEGTVEYIGWRVTHVRTFDKRPLYVPNGLFLTVSIENPSRMTNRRIKTQVGIRYDDSKKVEKITADIKSMLSTHPEIDTNQTLIVNLVAFGPSSLDILIYTFTKTTQWIAFQEIQQDVFVKILAIIENNGAECAFPTQTLHFAKDNDTPCAVSN